MSEKALGSDRSSHHCVQCNKTWPAKRYSPHDTICDPCKRSAVTLLHIENRVREREMRDFGMPKKISAV